MRHLRTPCLSVVLLYAVTAATTTAQPEVRRAAEAELAPIQETIRQLVRGVNDRNVAAVKAVQFLLLMREAKGDGSTGRAFTHSL